MPGHRRGLVEAENIEQGRCHVSQPPVLEIGDRPADGRPETAPG